MDNIEILAIKFWQYIMYFDAIDLTLNCLYWYIPLQTTFVEDMHGCRKESLLKNLSKIPKI